MDVSEVLQKQKRVIELLDEAETVRCQLLDCMRIGPSTTPNFDNLSMISTAQNTAPTSPILNIRDEPSNSSEISQFDVHSPLASTIFAMGSSRVSRRRNDPNVSAELKAILPTISSYTHRRALIAVDRYGYQSVKWTRGFTALHWAWKINRMDIVHYLLTKGADPNAVDEHGRTPSDYEPKQKAADGSLSLQEMVDLSSLPASQKSCLEVISKRGWNALKWTGGWTILHWAYQENREDIIKYLKSIGVSDDMVDSDGKRPMDYAKHKFSTN